MQPLTRPGGHEMGAVETGTLVCSHHHYASSSCCKPPAPPGCFPVIVMHLLPEGASWLWPRSEASLFYSAEQSQPPAPLYNIKQGLCLWEELLSELRGFAFLAQEPLPV